MAKATTAIIPPGELLLFTSRSHALATRAGLGLPREEGERSSPPVDALWHSTHCARSSAAATLPILQHPSRRPIQHATSQGKFFYLL